MSALRWETDGRDWPNHQASRFVRAGGLEWHVQELGEGPRMWLIHGTGASTHSWRDVLPLLAITNRVIAMDLPGHGFTSGRPRHGLGLRQMAEALAALAAEIGAPEAAIGAHSAGAAIAVRMALDGTHKAPIVAFGPALLPFPGMTGPFFTTLAGLLLVNPVVPSLFAKVAQLGSTDAFLRRTTGSAIDARGAALYGRLFASSCHCAGALEMMADWDLTPLARDLPHLPVPMSVLHGERDASIPIDRAREAAQRANAAFQPLPGLGHLAHEERPDLAAGAIIAAAKAARVAA